MPADSGLRGPDLDGVRTGWDKTRLAASNAELVARVAELCAEYNRVAATPAIARQILGLN